ncbi:MAG: AbrB/MazE/SpoVT family DNA-binding domain-containing protein [Opitutales bacterium]
MPTSTVSSRGQTTIPVDIQKLLNVKPGDKIQYFVEADGRVSLVPKTLSVRDLKGILPKPKKAVSIEDMDAAIENAATERFHGASDS